MARTCTATLKTLVVFVAVVRMPVAADRLFFKDKTGGGQTTIHASVGENIVLECEAGGSPSATIHWLRHGRRMQQVRWRVYIRSLLCKALYTVHSLYITSSSAVAEKPRCRVGQFSPKF